MTQTSSTSSKVEHTGPLAEAQVYDKDKHISLLEATNGALAEKLAFYQKRLSLRNNAASLRWRNKAMYLKKVVDQLRATIADLSVARPSDNGQQKEA